MITEEAVQIAREVGTISCISVGCWVNEQQLTVVCRILEEGVSCNSGS